MKIGVDCSRLTVKDRTGTENYLYYLLQHLAKLDSSDTYVLYFRDAPTSQLISEVVQGNTNFSYKVLKKIGSWTQISLALRVLLDRPDVLFCPWHTMPGLNRVKIVATIHDLTGGTLPMYWTTKFSNRLITVSEHTQESLVKKFNVKKSKTTVIYEGFDSASFYPRKDAEIAQVKSKYRIEKDYILFLGSLGPRKNIKRMISAFNSLNSGLEFVLGGVPLPGQEHLVNLPAHFIGRVAQKDLPALYSGARFLSFVSKEEGFGVPVLESMACGTPVLTANTSSTQEIAGNSALLVDPNSIDDISRGMRRLIEDLTLHKKLSNAGLERHSRFSWEKAAAQTLNVFREVASEK